MAGLGTGCNKRGEFFIVGVWYIRVFGGDFLLTDQANLITVAASDHVRVLGVTISSDLSLDKHVS